MSLFSCAWHILTSNNIIDVCIDTSLLFFFLLFFFLGGGCNNQFKKLMSLVFPLLVA